LSQVHPPDVGVLKFLGFDRGNMIQPNGPPFFRSLGTFPPITWSPPPPPPTGSFHSAERLTPPHVHRLGPVSSPFFAAFHPHNLQSVCLPHQTFSPILLRLIIYFYPFMPKKPKKTKDARHVHIAAKSPLFMIDSCLFFFFSLAMPSPHVIEPPLGLVLTFFFFQWTSPSIPPLAPLLPSVRPVWGNLLF